MRHGNHKNCKPNNLPATDKRKLREQEPRRIDYADYAEQPDVHELRHEKERRKQDFKKLLELLYSTDSDESELRQILRARENPFEYSRCVNNKNKNNDINTEDRDHTSMQEYFAKAMRRILKAVIDIVIPSADHNWVFNMIF